MVEKVQTEEKEKQLKVVDKRRIGRDKNAPSIEPNLKPTYVEQLEKKVEKMEILLKNKIAELEEESRKSRERVQRDLEKRFDEKLEKILLDLIDFMPSIENAIEVSSNDKRIKEGLEILYNSYNKFLEKQGLLPINPIGEDFDPNFMEAVQTAKGEKDKVIMVFQKGFKRGDKILKPPKVVVGNGE